MSQNERKGAKIQLGDGTKWLVYTVDSLCDLEESLGVPATALLADAKQLGFREIRALVWAGLHGAGSKFSLRDVGRLMEPSKLADYATAAGEALQKAFGTSSADEEPEHLRPTGPDESPDE